jgi:hypothetical protein
VSGACVITAEIDQELQRITSFRGRFGGPDSVWNYVSSCPTCNLEKAATWPVCPCPTCQGAIRRFLSDPVKRKKALLRLESQREEMTKGINAMRERINKLQKYHSKLSALSDDIENFQEEVTA